jgi:hypothetical protein
VKFQAIRGSVERGFALHQAAKVQLEASEWVIPEDLERFFSRFSAIRDIGPVVPTPGGNASRGGLIVTLCCWLVGLSVVGGSRLGAHGLRVWLAFETNEFR